MPNSIRSQIARKIAIMTVVSFMLGVGLAVASLFA